MPRLFAQLNNEEKDAYYRSLFQCRTRKGKHHVTLLEPDHAELYKTLTEQRKKEARLERLERKLKGLSYNDDPGVQADRATRRYP